MVLKTINGIFTKIENQTENTKLFTIELDEEIEFESGQFLNLIIEHEGEIYKRPYSIASANDNKDIIELTIKLVENGEFTPKLFEKMVGDECSIVGPLGMFKLNSVKPKEKVVLIGTGTGISSLRSILFELLKEKEERQIVLIYGNRFSSEILFEKELDDLAETYPQFKFVKVISRPDDNWNGRFGYVQNNLDSIDFLNSEIYICGWSNMVKTVKDKVILNGADEEFVYSFH